MTRYSWGFTGFRQDPKGRFVWFVEAEALEERIEVILGAKTHLAKSMQCQIDRLENSLETHRNHQCKKPPLMWLRDDGKVDLWGNPRKSWWRRWLYRHGGSE